MWTLPDAAAEWNISLVLLCRLVRAGVLPIYRIDGELRVRGEDISDVVVNDLTPAP